MKKLNKKNVGDIYRLTSMQEGLLFHYLKDPESHHYFEQLKLDLSGEIDIRCFDKAWNTVIDTNEMLRTVFRWEEVENPIQVVLKAHKLKTVYHDFSDKKAKEKQKLLAVVKEEDRRKKFDLREVPFRVTLCKIEKDKYEMIISSHHILYDGWSNGIILKEFFNAYHQYKNGKQLVEPLIKTKFKEFVTWNHSQDVKKQKKYWQEYLKNFDTKTGLPVKKTKAKDKAKPGEVENYSIQLAQEIGDQLESFVKKYKITLAALFYSTWGLLLQRYNNCRDVVFGSAVSARTANIKGIENIVGLFLNTLPLRIQTNPKESVMDFLYKINKMLEQMGGYVCTSLVNIRECSQLDSQEELFDMIATLENYPLDIKQLQEKGHVNVRSYSITETPHYDLFIDIIISRGIEVNFNYDKNCFDKEIIKNIANHYRQIVRGFIENPARDVTEIDLMSEAEKKQILFDFNNGGFDSAGIGETIGKLFAQQVEKTPQNTAIVYLDVKNSRRISLTYRELDEKSSRLAQTIRKINPGPETVIGLMVERSVEMMVGILGIIKAGGAYLPINPNYPKERIKYMLEDSNAAILLSKGDLLAKAGEIGFKGEIIDLYNENNYPGGENKPDNFTTSARLAYIIYTSGSTGRPKGVMVEHGSVVSLVKNPNFIDFSETDSLLLTGAIVFDITTFETWGALLNGLTLYLIDDDVILDAEKMREIIHDNHISILHLIPQLFNQLVVQCIEIFSGLTYYLTGGDIVRPKYLNEIRKRYKHLKVVNTYGPTENTTFTTAILVERDYEETITIGKPINSATVYILSESGQLQPLGIPGELCTGGSGVARGYLNNVELTAEKFRRAVISHSSLVIDGFSQFFPNDQYPMTNDRLYRTGDLAMWLPEGNIEFLGRIDQQVKIRGMRIELGEIEAQLVKLPEIKEAIVMVVDDPAGSGTGNGTPVTKEKTIYAYIVSQEKLEVSSLKKILSGSLPDYMIPSYFVQLEKMPLTANGKIDRKALPAPEIIRTGGKYTAPVSEMEKRLVKIWSDVLGIEEEIIGIDTLFFDLGGHSLKAINLIARIHKEFGLKVSLVEMFKAPTIRGLSAYMQREAAEYDYASLELAEEKRYYPLSSAQKRLYFLQQMDETGTAYNITAAWVLEGTVDNNRLAQTFIKLIRRHESFRTSFQMVGEEPLQRIHKEVQFEIEGLAHPGARLDNQQAASTIKNFIRPFDLSQAPLLRVGLIELPHTPAALRSHPRRGTYNSQEGKEHKHMLIVDMHHIISDGISTRVLIRDFMALYSDEELPGMRLRYKDYGQWQDREKESPRLLHQARFWQDQFRGEIPVLELPTDFERPGIQRFEGSSVSFEIGREHTSALNALASEKGATLYIVLLALYGILLSKLSNQEDIVIGSPVGGRRHADLEKIIGMFVNTLALRNYPKGEKSFSEFLTEVKEKTLMAFENQEYPYEELVDRVSVNRDISRNPLFDTFFLYRDVDASGFEIPGLTLTPYEYETKTAKFDLLLEGWEVEEILRFQLEYSTKLFKRETIERFVTYFKNIVSGVLADKENKISELVIISGEEREKLLIHFNDTGTDFPGGKKIHQLFEEQVDRVPDHIAVVGAHQLYELNQRKTIFLTYKELNDRTNQLAVIFKEKGVVEDAIVGIIVERSLDMIEGILGILKAGGAYLPIEPDYPHERIAYMLADSGAGLLATTRIMAEQGERVNIVYSQLSIINYQQESCKPSLFSVSPVADNNLAYVIYTSGSTGKSKGVLVEQSSVVNVLLVLQQKYPLSREDAYLLKTSYVFDVSVSELLGWFLAGGRLVILESGAEKDPRQIFNAIERHRITHVNFVPSMFSALLELLETQPVKRFSRLRYIFLAGEALLPGMVKRFQGLNPEVLLENIYGPTENTIYASAYSLSEWDGCGDIPIGKPLPNMKLYILDKYFYLQPVGVTGELCLGGAGLARGYLNRPELTLEKFDHDLWDYQDYRDKRRKIPGEGILKFYRSYRSYMSYIYRTGDLARWLQDGNVQFLGRMDLQVKIRGFRVEPGEIENQLLKFDTIKEAVVTAGKASGSSADKNEQDSRYLCAYIVMEMNPAPAVSRLKDFLSKELPDYMIPSHFVQVEKIPLTPSGKIDREALQKYGQAIGTGVDFVAPRNKIEKRIAETWKEVLGRDKVGIYENFFDLGGTSLDIFKVTNRLKDLVGRDIPVTSIFRYTTIHSFAQYLTQKEIQDSPEDPDHSSSGLKRAEKAKMNRLRVRKGLIDEPQ